MTWKEIKMYYRTAEVKCPITQSQQHTRRVQIWYKDDYVQRTIAMMTKKKLLESFASKIDLGLFIPDQHFGLWLDIESGTKSPKKGNFYMKWFFTFFSVFLHTQGYFSVLIFGV